MIRFSFKYIGPLRYVGRQTINAMTFIDAIELLELDEFEKIEDWELEFKRESPTNVAGVHKIFRRKL